MKLGAVFSIEKIQGRVADGRDHKKRNGNEPAPLPSFTPRTDHPNPGPMHSSRNTRLKGLGFKLARD